MLTHEEVIGGEIEMLAVKNYSPHPIKSVTEIILYIVCAFISIFSLIAV